MTTAIATLVAAAVLMSSGPTAPRSVPPRGTPWEHDPAASVEVAEPTPSPPPKTEDAAPKKESRVPSPKTVRPRPRIDVAVGLDPSAPGSKSERAIVDALETSVAASSNPPARTRRLRAGSPSGREVCRAGREELVILVGYVPTRDEPVLLVHDCGLDTALDLRASTAASEPGLVGTLWDEHDALVRDGVKQRRRLRGLSPRARAGIIGGVAVVLIGVAVGVLVASALRDEKVVLKVSP